MKIRVVMDIDVPLFAEEPDDDPEFTAQLEAQFGPEPSVGPGEVARVLAMMLGAPDADAFQSVAIEEALFDHIESVKVISAEKLADPDKPALL